MLTERDYFFKELGGFGSAATGYGYDPFDGLRIELDSSLLTLRRVAADHFGDFGNFAVWIAWVLEFGRECQMEVDAGFQPRALFQDSSQIFIGVPWVVGRFQNDELLLPLTPGPSPRSGRIEDTEAIQRSQVR